jgi:cell division septal protein FtsQ
MPGLADRLVTQAEQQTNHRIYMERRKLNSNILKSLIGLSFGFFIGILGVGGGMYLTFMGFNVIGIIFSSATLVSLVMAFIYGSQSKRYNYNLTAQSS